MPSPHSLPLPLTPGHGWPWNHGGAAAIQPAKTPSTGWPKISIVTPSFNQGEFLEQTIRSVLLQGYPNLEYIVIDGASSDDSAATIRHYAGFLDFWVSEPDRGQAHAINKGLEKTTGEILAWLNSDDYLLPGALAAIADLYRQQPKAVAWAGGVIEKDLNGDTTHIHQPQPGDCAAFADWGKTAYVSQPGCFFSRAGYQQAGGLDERLHNVLDVEFWMRLAPLGRFAVTDQLLAVSRIYPEAKTYRDIPLREAEHIHISLLHGEKEVAKTRLNRYVREHIIAHVLEHTPAITADYLLTEPLATILRLMSRSLLKRTSRRIKRLPVLRRFFRATHPDGQ